MAWWTRTAHNERTGKLLMNDPDGWVIDQPELRWLGSDSLASLTAGGSSPNNGMDVAEPGNSFPAITRATGLICDPIAGSKWEVKRGRETLPTPRWISDPALSRPDGRVSDWQPTGRNALGPVAFWTQVILSALWYGDAFLLVATRNPEGVPVPPLLLLHPLLVKIVGPGEVDSTFTETGYWLNVPGDGNTDESWVHLEAHEVIHIPGMPPYWGGRGRGAITGHLKSWQEAVAQRNYSTGIFTAGIPAGYLKVTAPNLTEEQSDRLRERWDQKHGAGSGARGIAVLNAVTDFVAVQMSPDALQMGDARKQSTLDVANAFGVEAYMLGLPSDNSTYANIESRMRHFVQFTLLPWARRIEGALESEFPLGTELVIDLDSLTRADTASRIAYYGAGQAGGWLTVDEIRLAEGLPPLDPADVSQTPPAPPALVPPVTEDETPPPEEAAS